MVSNNEIIVKAPEFTGENIPISEVAKILRKDPQYVRQGIIQGYLPIGVAVKNNGSSQYDFYVSPMKLWQFTGYVWKGSVVNGIKEEC